MQIQFVPVTFSEILESLKFHLNTLPARVDSYMEDHICAATHYCIVIGDAPVGYASIYEQSLITQFVLGEDYKQYGQKAFQQLRNLEQVQAAYVPTCDEFYLAHALDDYRQLAKQAYFFRTGQVAFDQPIPSGFALRLAESDDMPFIQEQSGDFFGAMQQHIEAQELYLVQSADTVVGFGLRQKSRLYQNVASIGMYTIERFRRTGVATATIALLIQECQRTGWHAVAGCWYYNHSSKKTLEKAGMFSQTRLLKVDY